MTCDGVFLCWFISTSFSNLTEQTVHWSGGWKKSDSFRRCVSLWLSTVRASVRRNVPFHLKFSREILIVILLGLCSLSLSACLGLGSSSGSDSAVVFERLLARLFMPLLDDDLQLFNLIVSSSLLSSHTTLFGISDALQLSKTILAKLFGS